MYTVFYLTKNNKTVLCEEFEFEISFAEPVFILTVLDADFRWVELSEWEGLNPYERAYFLSNSFDFNSYQFIQSHMFSFKTLRETRPVYTYDFNGPNEISLREEFGLELLIYPAPVNGFDYTWRIQENAFEITVDSGLEFYPEMGVILTDFMPVKIGTYFIELLYQGGAVASRQIKVVDR